MGMVARKKIKDGFFRKIIFLLLFGTCGIVAVAIPLIKSLVQMATSYFVAGFCLSILEIGLQCILLHTHNGELKSYFHAYQLLYGVGYMIGPTLSRITMKKMEENLQSLDEKLPEDLSPFFYTTGILFWVLCLCWITFLKKTTLEPNWNILLKSKLSFKLLAAVTWCADFLAAFLIGTLQLCLQNFLFMKAATLYHLNTRSSMDINLTYWSCYLLGAFICLLLSKRFPPWLFIILSIAMETGAILILYQLAMHAVYIIYIANAIMGVAASSMLTSTLMWLHGNYRVTEATIAAFFLGKALSEMIMPSIMQALLHYSTNALYYFLIPLPTLDGSVIAAEKLFLFKTSGTDARNDTSITEDIPAQIPSNEIAISTEDIPLKNISIEVLPNHLELTSSEENAKVKIDTDSSEDIHHSESDFEDRPILPPAWISGFHSKNSRTPPGKP